MAVEYGKRFQMSQMSCPPNRGALLSAGVLASTAAILVAVGAATLAAEQAAPAAAVTFAKDIAPIFQRSCQQCHQPDSIGPMSLVTYQDVRPWARSIRQRVVAGEMPPY